MMLKADRIMPDAVVCELLFQHPWLPSTAAIDTSRVLVSVHAIAAALFHNQLVEDEDEDEDE